MEMMKRKNDGKSVLHSPVDRDGINLAISFHLPLPNRLRPVRNAAFSAGVHLPYLPLWIQWRASGMNMRWGHYNMKENDTRAAANAELKIGHYNRFHSMIWQVDHPNTSGKISLSQSASNKTQRYCLPQFYGAVGCRWDCQLRFCLSIFADHRLSWNVIFVIIYMDCHAVCCRRKGGGVTLWFGACGLVVVGWSVVLACFGLADRKMDRGQRCRGTDSYRRTTSILNRPAAFGLWCVCQVCRVGCLSVPFPRKGF